MKYLTDKEEAARTRYIFGDRTKATVKLVKSGYKKWLRFPHKTNEHFLPDSVKSKNETTP